MQHDTRFYMGGGIPVSSPRSYTSRFYEIVSRARELALQKGSPTHFFIQLRADERVEVAEPYPQYVSGARAEERSSLPTPSRLAGAAFQIPQLSDNPSLDVPKLRIPFPGAPTT